MAAEKKKERENLPVSISLINKGLFDDDSFDFIVDEIMALSRYTLQPLHRRYTRERSLRIYYHTQPKDVRWVPYLRPALTDQAPLLAARNRVASFVCFIGAGEDIFVLTGGLGKFEVLDYLSPQFGIDILTRLVAKSSPSIRAIQERDVTGSILGGSRFYRGKQRLTDEDQFGKVTKKINAELNKSILLRRLGFSDAEIARGSIGCWAESSFQLGKSIGFARTLSLIDRLSVLLAEAAPYTLNNVRLISPRGDGNKTLIKKLHEQLKADLYEECRQGRLPNFDFCNREFESYLTASRFFIDLDGEDDFEETEAPSLRTIIQHFEKKDRWTIKTVEEFDYGFLQQRLVSYDAEGMEATNDHLLHHFHGEVRFGGLTYFYLDKQWYWVEDSFIADLNDQCQILIDQCLDETLISLSFSTGRSEALFNDQFLGQPNWLVLDTIFADNIESCDLLHHNDQQLCFVHVKKGFNNSIRELASQVGLAARRIAHDKMGSYTYIATIEDQAKGNHKSENLRLQKIAKQSFPAGGITGLLMTRNPEQIVFCLAFVDDNDSDERSIKTQLAVFRSNIAKFSLLKLARDIRQYGFQFKIVQIKKA